MSKKIQKIYYLDEEVEHDLRRLCAELKISQTSLIENTIEIILQTLKRQRGEVK